MLLRAASLMTIEHRKKCFDKKSSLFAALILKKCFSMDRSNLHLLAARSKQNWAETFRRKDSPIPGIDNAKRKKHFLVDSFRLLYSVARWLDNFVQYLAFEN